MANDFVTSFSKLTKNESLINIIKRLDRVKNIGPGKWIARCPAHSDSTPSLSIKETEDGVILLHCFAGCNTRAILDAIGLDYSDLFPGFKKQSSSLKSRANAGKILEKTLKRIAEEAIIEEIRITEKLLRNGGWEEIMNNGPNSEPLTWLAHRLTYLDYLWHELTTNGISSDIFLWLRKEAIV